MFMTMLLFVQTVALPQQSAAPSPMSPADAASDARCMVVFGFIGSRGTPEQAEETKRAILYFTGKLRGRDPAVNVGAAVARAAEAAKAAGLDPRGEAARCTAELQNAGESLRGIRGALATPKP